MLKIKENNKINASEIYSYVGVKTPMRIWIKRCIEIADLKQGMDFSTFLYESSGGRKPIEYEFTIDAAKEICIVSATSKAKELRRWLIELSNQKENLDLLTHDQILYLRYLESFYKFVDKQKEVGKEHLDKYVKDHHTRNPYSDFHIWRNKLLSIEKIDIEKMVMGFTIQNQRQITKTYTKERLLNILDSYNGLRNAVFDFLSIKGEINALKLANLVKDMAKIGNTPIYSKNETSLFQIKEQLNDPKMIK